MIWFHEYPIIVLWLSHDYPYWTTWKTITSPAITVPSRWWSHSPPLDSASITAAPFHGHNALVRLAGSMRMLGSFIWESMGKPTSLNDNGLFYMGELWHFHMVENDFCDNTTIIGHTRTLWDEIHDSSGCWSFRGYHWCLVARPESTLKGTPWKYDIDWDIGIQWQVIGYIYIYRCSTLCYYVMAMA